VNWAPIWVDAPVPSEPFQLALLTLMADPDCDHVPDQPLLSFWLPL
jgi:hypothetical protein